MSCRQLSIALESACRCAAVFKVDGPFSFQGGASHLRWFYILAVHGGLGHAIPDDMIRCTQATSCPAGAPSGAGGHKCFGVAKTHRLPISNRTEPIVQSFFIFSTSKGIRLKKHSARPVFPVSHLHKDIYKLESTHQPPARSCLSSPNIVDFLFSRDAERKIWPPDPQEFYMGWDALREGKAPTSGVLSSRSSRPRSLQEGERQARGQGARRTARRGRCPPQTAEPESVLKLVPVANPAEFRGFRAGLQEISARASPLSSSTA